MSDGTSVHTPGPWVVGYKAMDVMAEDSKGPFKVCDIRGWGHFTGKGHGALGLPSDQAIAIQEANAALIAAAPDLLEAAVKTIEENGHLADGDNCTLRHLKVAIAKAKGKAAFASAQREDQQ